MTFRTTEPSRTLQLNELAKDMAAAGETVYRFGFGQSPFMPPRRVQDALHEATGRVDYAPVQGIRELREKIAQFHTATEGIDTSPEQIIVGSGSKILLLNTLMAFEPAHVVLPAPSWVSYKPQAQMAGHELHWIPTTFEQRWRITPAQLDAHMATLDGRSKILVLNYPGNPDGLTYTAPELEALAPVLEKHGVWVLSDEIYGMVHHDGAHVSLRKYYPQRTLVTSGLSKWCAAGGWRMGVQLLPVDIPVAFRDALLAIASSSYSCAPTPVQVAAIPGYIWDEVSQTYIGRQQHILRVLGQQVYRILADGGVAVHPPQGGFYFLTDFSPLRESLAARGIFTDDVLCANLLAETGVILLPGAAFGMQPENLTARLSYVDFSGAQIMNAMADAGTPPGDEDVVALIDRYCAHMLEGLHKLVEWLQ